MYSRNSLNSQWNVNISQRGQLSTLDSSEVQGCHSLRHTSKMPSSLKTLPTSSYPDKEMSIEYVRGGGRGGGRSMRGKGEVSGIGKRGDREEREWI